ncbi:probable mediator of RNA polymerase II transcription subunit 26b [Zingiber officinale]|uniref:probable mediator of RNA polymerase II transcription subunit 26b n=1 Tax=Zingiber officinale TaxID=94328 RepID=UPI001C4A94E0|nr:probable mediator of RNA polymerase II transcription subunit 26b [Zingiber officinale]
MASSSGSVDYWRKFFRSADSDIFDVIEHAILVAASDYPEELRSRRDRIVEKFFAALLPRCFACGRVEPHGAEAEEGRGSVKRAASAEKDSKFDSCNDGPEFSHRVVSNYTFDEAEALTEEIEEEGQTLEEVLRIKEVLSNHHDQSDNVLFESLRRLQLMELTVDVLKATEIGKAVNVLRKHVSKQIRHLVRTLIDGWKVLVDEWVSATAAIAENSVHSLGSGEFEEEGLPFPPLDEGALFAAQTTSIKLSGFFDGMDDDGNLRNTRDLDKQWETQRNQKEDHEKWMQKQSVRDERVESMKQEARKSALPEEKLHARRHDNEMKQSRPQRFSIGQSNSQNILSKETKPLSAESGTGRPMRFTSEQQICAETKTKLPPDTAKLQRKLPMIPQDKSKCSEEASVRAKLEAAKRKLHEGYQQAENVKKQRTIQVMELQDLPKQVHINRQPIQKFRNQSRNWANRRN